MRLSSAIAGTALMALTAFCPTPHHHDPAPVQHSATQAVSHTIEEDEPGWDWRTMGNGCRGIGNGALECVGDPGADPVLWAMDGHWTYDDTQTHDWFFCPTGRSDLECGA
jgi:hypothetical protein